MKETDYDTLIQRLRAVAEDVRDDIANLANAAALIFETLPDLNWAGFYRYLDGRLLLGPFQGRAACTVIAVGKGVCGAAAERDATLSVPDVHEFPGHIACDCASKSEIVIPIHRGGALYGVLDIDSPVTARFSETDREGLERVVAALEEILA